jgi:hypothetical protein
LIVALAGAGILLPDDVTSQRSIVVPADAAVLHAYVSTLSSWPEWTPWSTRTDPTATFQFSGARSGAGAKWSWKGEKMDEGQMEIVESDPARGIRYHLTMTGGLTVNGSVSYASQDGGTKVSWMDKCSLGMGPLGGWMKVLLGGMIEKEMGSNQEKALSGLRDRAAL